MVRSSTEKGNAPWPGRRVTEKAVKEDRREHEQQFKWKGSQKQFICKESIVNKIKFAKHQLNPAQHGLNLTVATEKMVHAFIEERKKSIKLANCSDTS